MDPRNMARAEDFFHGMGIKVVTGSRYLGVFVGYRETEDICWQKKYWGGHSW